MNPRLTLKQAESPEQVVQARELFVEYAESLGFSLCFQSFDQELAGLPGDYTPPDGRLLLAEYRGQLAGCVALHKLSPEICEMKRLYLRPQLRGKGVGRALIEAVYANAATSGASRVYWHTHETNATARLLYDKVATLSGFVQYRKDV